MYFILKLNNKETYLLEILLAAKLIKNSCFKVYTLIKTLKNEKSNIKITC